MTQSQIYITALLIFLAVIIPRALPFVLFPEGKEPPKFIKKLSTTLPYAVIGSLVVYCFKDVSVTDYPHGIPELIALACLVGVHMWRKNTLISMATGTIVYMLLVQLVFVA